jgi:hypothetical protein
LELAALAADLSWSCALELLCEVREGEAGVARVAGVAGVALGCEPDEAPVVGLPGVAGVAGVALMLLLERSPEIEPLVDVSLDELVPPKVDPVVVVSMRVALLPGTVTDDALALPAPQSLTHTRTWGSNCELNCSKVHVLPSLVSDVVLGVTAAPSMQRSMHARTGAS